MSETPAPPAEALLQRGRLLLLHNRPADAERFLRESLAHDPLNVEALHLLSICVRQGNGREREALELADRALAREPEWTTLHVQRSLILSDLRRLKDAREAAETAIARDPEDSSARAALGYAFLRESRWAEAEAAARQALAHDADDTLAQNVLSQALVWQGKAAESAADVAARLARNPEDAFTHLNAGYAALRDGDHRQAETHFLEALRLQPEFDAAREGLLESFRARSAPYRIYLRYAFAMAQFSEKRRMAIMVGIYVVYRVLVAVLSNVSPAVVGALVVAYFLFATWTYVARGVGTLFILSDPRARLALRPREKAEGALVGGAVVAGLLLMISSAAVGDFDWTVGGGGLLACGIALAIALGAPMGWGRWLYGALAALIIGSVALIFLALIWPSGSFSSFGVPALRIAGFGLLVATLLAGLGVARTR